MSQITIAVLFGSQSAFFSVTLNEFSPASGDRVRDRSVRCKLFSAASTEKSSAENGRANTKNFSAEHGLFIAHHCYGQALRREDKIRRERGHLQPGEIAERRL